MKNKTYSQRVFAGKDIPVIGMDQGKGMLYGSVSAHVCSNFYFDAVFTTREGQDYVESYAEGIALADRGTNFRFIQKYTDLWVEEITDARINH